MKTYNRALIIDDDHDLGILLQTLLCDIVPNVAYASTLDIGMQLIQETKPDVIFVDNNLPDGQGIYSLRKIKNMLPDSLVILISAMDNFDAPPSEYGADVFLPKPLTLSRITKALDVAA